MALELNQSNKSQYFAAQSPDKVTDVLLGKANEWQNNLQSNGYIEKLKSAYYAYYGAYYSDTASGHQITFGGEQGELVNLPVNHYRNIAQHILVMTTSNRPAMEAKAVNTDYKSSIQTALANSILEYYLREKKLENYLKEAVETAIALGAGFIKMEWDASKGEPVDYNEDTSTIIYEGDIAFSNLSPFDVVFDGSKEHQNHDWVLIRTWKNKYDLAAKYPEYYDEIIKLATKSDTDKFHLGVTNLVDSTDDVAVYEFYHKRTECMSDGRYLLFLSETIVLQDLPMPYRTLPIFRIAPSNILGTPHGYTPMFDLLPLQEMLNACFSTISTNISAFGVQNILNPRGSDIAVNALQGGLNIIDYNANAAGGGKPEPLELCATPKEVYDFINILTQTMETLSGVNGVARGNPEASLKSGTALALVQSMALQFMSGLQESYVQLIEEIGSSIIKILQDYATSPRLVTIAGKSNRNYMKEFSSRDISNISRVAVQVGNPMAMTTAGRVQMAQELIQYGEISPKQYVNILHTGNLDDLTDQTFHENLLMRAENEAIMDGENPPVTIVDNHKEHIEYHKGLLGDPDLRKDEGLVQRVTQHIQAHINQLRTGDPALLMLLGQQPLPPPAPPGGPPPQQGPPNGPQGPQAPPNGNGPIPQEMMPPEQGQVGPGVQGNHITGPGLPDSQRIASPAKVAPQMLQNPGMQQAAMGNVKK